MDVGRNIGAELLTDQAEADKRIAQARAENRRAMAVAAEREMMARGQEMRAQLVQAEAQVPLALADVFRAGRLVATPPGQQEEGGQAAPLRPNSGLP